VPSLGLGGMLFRCLSSSGDLGQRVLHMGVLFETCTQHKTYIVACCSRMLFMSPAGRTAFGSFASNALRPYEHCTILES
jgi:hypothetical protein